VFFLFCGFGLMSKVGPMPVIALAVAAIAVGSAVLLILDLSNPIWERSAPRRRRSNRCWPSWAGGDGAGPLRRPARRFATGYEPRTGIFCRARVILPFSRGPLSGVSRPHRADLGGPLSAETGPSGRLALTLKRGAAGRPDLRRLACGAGALLNKFTRLAAGAS
jgi:hypothetical protein